MREGVRLREKCLQIKLNWEGTTYIATDIATSGLNRPLADSVKKGVLSFQILAIRSLTRSLQLSWILLSMERT